MDDEDLKGQSNGSDVIAFFVFIILIIVVVFSITKGYYYSEGQETIIKKVCALKQYTDFSRNLDKYYCQVVTDTDGEIIITKKDFDKLLEELSK